MFIGVLGLAGSAQAALLTGVTLGCGQASGSNPITCTPNTTVVGSGVEFTFPLSGLSYSVDIDENGFIDINYLNSATFNNGATTTLQLTDALGGVADFTDFNLITATNVTGYTPFDLSFTANSLVIKLGNGKVWSQGGSIRTQVIVGSVPEPATIGIVSIGMAGIAIAARRRKSRPTA